MWRLLLLALPTASYADSLIAARNIQAKTTIEFEDVIIVASQIEGALLEPSEAVGKEARTTIYAGQPILRTNLTVEITVKRNQVVPIVYEKNRLSIYAEGRALSQGAAGDVIEVMNISSRKKLSGTIQSDGSISVNEE